MKIDFAGNGGHVELANASRRLSLRARQVNFEGVEELARFAGRWLRPARFPRQCALPLDQSPLSRGHRQAHRRAKPWLPGSLQEGRASVWTGAPVNCVRKIGPHNLAEDRERGAARTAWVEEAKERRSAADSKMEATSTWPFWAASRLSLERLSLWSSRGSWDSIRATTPACPSSMARRNALRMRRLRSGMEAGMRSLTHSAWPLRAAARMAWDWAALGLEAGMRSLTHSACPLWAAQ